MVSKVDQSKNIVAVGRRKESVARVRLVRGVGEMVVNGELIGEYFPGEAAKMAYIKPFELTGTGGKYFATIKVAGGGKVGQLDAAVLGIARALNILDKEKYRSVLKAAGLLRRDARVRERRKFGLAQKARARKQSPKR